MRVTRMRTSKKALELKHVLLLRKRVCAIRESLTKAITHGGWNAERVYIQDELDALDERIQALQDQVLTRVLGVVDS